MKQLLPIGFSLVALLSVPAWALDTRDTVATKTGHVVFNSFDNCVRSKWVVGEDMCAPKKAETGVATPVRRSWAQEERTVYFNFNQASLTADSKAKLDTLATNLKSEADVKEARIIGYADRIGQTKYNEQLSRKRAESVQRYIVSRGFVNARVAETRWLGEQAPVTNCPDTLSRQELIACLQKDRRVEVEIDYLPESQATPWR